MILNSARGLTALPSPALRQTLTKTGGVLEAGARDNENQMQLEQIRVIHLTLYYCTPAKFEMEIAA